MTAQRTREGGNWLWAKRDAIKIAAKHGPLCVAVYTALCALESAAPTDQKAEFPASWQEIFEFSGVKKTAGRAALKQLQALGLVDWVSGRNSGRLLCRNKYRLLDLFNKPLLSSGDNRALLSSGEVSRSSRGELPLLSAGELPLLSPGDHIYKEKEERIPPPSAGGILSKEKAEIAPCAKAPALPAPISRHEEFMEELRVAWAELEQKVKRGEVVR